MVSLPDLPGWVPEPVRLYLGHTEEGISLRALARARGVHASTVMRQVRRYECRRDDPLMDAALSLLSQSVRIPSSPDGQKVPQSMTPIPAQPLSHTVSPARAAALAAAPAGRGAALHHEPLSPETQSPETLPDEGELGREALRILRRLAEPGAVLAFANDMEKAAVLRELPDGRTVRTAVLERGIAQAFCLQDWISCRKTGRISTYGITQAGRAALRRQMDEGRAASGGAATGLSEAAAPFTTPHRAYVERSIPSDEGPRRTRFNTAESPVAVLGRRREKNGELFLSHDLVAAAERLREDFELAQMGPRVAQNWENFLTAGSRGSFQSGAGPAEGPGRARARVAAALDDLGPGLGDIALRVCCFLEGVESAERRMGWAARSGKIVLRIALLRLRRHYDETYGRSGPLIG
ncbi:helix-turn-helix domain-containing protein [Xinfangfangia sp. D13-10-4-6]|nr:helix-turn-helix domain-containing protein [Pseudogemmobacter hezensis]